MHVPPLETERLQLRQLSVDDASDMHSAMRNPEAMRYVYELPHESIQVTRETFAKLSQPGSYNWAVRLRGSTRCIGFVGFLSDRSPEGLGYFLHPEFWRRGYMTESARAALSCAFTTLGFRQAEAWIADGNVGSFGVARRLGFQPVGRLLVRYPHHPATVRYQVHGLWAHEYLGGDAGDEAPPAILYAVPELPVRDVPRSIEFYTRGLGFRLAFTGGDPPAFAAVTPSAWTGAPGQIRLMQAARASSPPPEITLTVEDVDELFARYTRSGVRLEGPIEVMALGVRLFTVLDPDGYALRFTGP